MKKNGRTVHASVATSLIRDKKNNPLHFITQIQDITKRKQAEKLNKTLAHILDVAPNSITIHNTQGNFLYANDETFKVHGYTEPEFMSMNLHELDVPESEELIITRVEKIKSQGSVIFEAAHYRKDGSIVPLEVLAKTVDWYGTQCVLSIATDITERKKVEQKLRESNDRYKASEERFRGFYDYSAVGIAQVSKKGKFLRVNKKFCDIVGYSGKELKALSFKDITLPEDISLDMEHVSQVLAGEKDNFELDKRYVRKDGSVIWVRLYSSVVRNQDGEIQYAIGSIINIDAVKRFGIDFKPVREMGIIDENYIAFSAFDGPVCIASVCVYLERILINQSFTSLCVLFFFRSTCIYSKTLTVLLL